MKLEITELSNGIRQVKLSGRLDMQGTNQIGDTFAFRVATEKALVLVDLSEVDFLASIGIRLILSNARALGSRGGKLVLCNPSPLIADVLTTAGVHELVQIYQDFEAACAALQA